MIHKTIGSTLFLFSLLSLVHCTTTYAKLHLACLDAHHRPCDTIAMGERYYLEVRLEDIPSNAHIWPQISGLSPEWIVGRHQRQETKWQNSKQSTATYFVWEVILNKVGTLTLAASYHTTQGQQLTTPPLSLTVHEQTTHNTAGHSPTASTATTFIRWESERLDPFIGEVFPIQLVLYTTDKAIHIENISEITVQNADLALSSQPEWGTATHNGLSYTTAKWKGHLCIQKAGVLHLPVVSISYTLPQRGNASRWAMMQIMLSPFASVEVKRTAPASYNARALPETTHHVSGVGVVHEITRQFSKPEINCGEAGSLIYSLKGKIHPHVLSLPELDIDNSAVKVYTTPATHTGEFPSYTYEKEFVIHPIKPTVIQLDEQMLWFFNPDTERYDCITIPPCEITVRQSSATLTTPTETEEHTATNSEGICNDNQQKALTCDNFAQIQSPLYQSRHPLLPLPWFLLWLVFPCLILLSKQRCSTMFYTVKRYLITAWLSRKTLRNINAAIQTRNAYLLLQSMQNFIRQQYNTAPNVSVDTYITNNVLRENEPHITEDWQKLWSQLQQCAFGTIYSTEEFIALGTRCKEWVSLLIQLHNKGVR